jgi:hypothetical protein
VSGKTLSYLIGLPALALFVLYTRGDRMPDCVGLRVLFTGATIFGAKLQCGLDAVGAALSANNATPAIYTFKPGIQCSWMAADKYYPIDPPLRTANDGAYIIKLPDARLSVAADGSAKMADPNGNPVQSGNCHRVGGL